jgi:hypothetical protein
VDGEDFDALIAAMGAWAADQRAEEAAEGRSRTGWLRRQAAEAATLSGVLVDLAERAAPVTLETLSGPYDGQVEVVTTGLCGLRRPEGGVILAAAPTGWRLETEPQPWSWTWPAPCRPCQSTGPW